MEPFATLTELKAGLEWELDEGEERLGARELETVSDEIRVHGRMAWVDAESAPPMVKKIALRAVARFLRNPDSFTQSRAGDETVAWDDLGAEYQGQAYLTENEKKILKKLSGHTALHSVQITAFRTRPALVDVLVPTGGTGDDFPFGPFLPSQDPLL